MIALTPFEYNGVLFAPEMNRTVVEFAMTDMDSGQWTSVRMLLDDFITYLEAMHELFWGVDVPVRIRRILERFTTKEYEKILIDFVRPYLPAPKEPESVTQAVAAGVFDLSAQFNPVWN